MIKFDKVINCTGFIALPVSMRKHGDDDECRCRYCSRDGKSSDKLNEHGVWDTMAVCLQTGDTWTVHYPQLTGRRPVRGEDDEKAS